MIGTIVGYGVSLALIAGYVVYVTLRSDGSVTMRRFLEWLVYSVLRPPRVIYDGTGTDPYLSRSYLTNRPKMPDGSDAWDEHGDMMEGSIPRRSPVSFFIHRFLKSDSDRELHSHPCKWAICVSLAGGYIEERWDPETGRVLVRKVKPWSINILHHDTFHRVDLIESDAWSFVIWGPKYSSWGFMDRMTGVFTPWRQFLGNKRKAS